MKTLQIVQYDKIKSSLAFNDVEKPSVTTNAILVKVRAASLNPIDYKLAQGHLKEMVPLDLPATIGFDLSGVVVAVGEEVSNFKEGDEIYARVPQEQMGTLAEYVSVDSDKVALKPANITFAEAAGLPLAGLTAIQALQKAGLKKGDRVLIHAGSGGVGSFAVQYAKAMGATVYTTTSSKNVEWVKTLKADRVIDYKKEDYKEIANDLDIVFDTLGDTYTLEAFKIIKKGGTVTSIAGPVSEEMAAQMGMADYQLPEELANLIQKKSATYKFTWMQPDAAQLNEITSMVEAGQIKPIIDRIYSFNFGIDAYEHLATGRAKGKVIINIS